jgi:muramidase (phage lysozyme)
VTAPAGKDPASAGEFQDFFLIIRVIATFIPKNADAFFPRLMFPLGTVSSREEETQREYPLTLGEIATGKIQVSQNFPFTICRLSLHGNTTVAGGRFPVLKSIIASHG